MALLLYVTSFFPKDFQGCEAAGTDIPYGHLTTCDCTYRPCPRSVVLALDRNMAG